jgi:mRNA interferase MazF
MARETYIPDRGDLVHMNFQPSAGREQTGPRYAIIVSPKSYNRKSGLAICCPITSHVKGYPFEVAIAGKAVGGVALSDHVRSVDFRERSMTYVEAASRETLDAVVSMVLELVDPQQA